MEAVKNGFCGKQQIGEDCWIVGELLRERSKILEGFLLSVSAIIQQGWVALLSTFLVLLLWNFCFSDFQSSFTLLQCVCSYEEGGRGEACAVLALQLLQL